MIELRIEGAEKLDALARKMKELGDGQIRRDLLKNLRTAVAPLIVAARASAEATLPHQGGLAQLVARDTKIKVSSRLTGQKAGVRLTATLPGHDIRSMDRGRLRHPVFGHRDRWVNQQITPGWFTKPINAGAPAIRASIVALLDDTARSLHV